MTALEIRESISRMGGAFTFDYHGVHYVIEPYSLNNFDIWIGDDTVKAHSIDEIMCVSLFDGKSLSAIAEDIENIDDP